MFEPIAIALKFGFIALLYLFLLWVVRSSVKDLRAMGADEGDDRSHKRDEGRGLVGKGRRAGAIVVEKAKSLQPGSKFEVGQELTIGRSSACDLRLDDTFSSHRHARIFWQRGKIYIEDLGSTNGTFLNGGQLTRPEPLKDEDRVRIGDTEMRYER